MADKWYYAKDGKQMAPVSKQELQRLISTGEINPADLVWSEGMPRWVSAESFETSLMPQAIAANPQRSPMSAGSSVMDDDAEFDEEDRFSERRSVRKDKPGWKLPVVPICIGVCFLAFAIGCGIFLLPHFVPASTRPMQGTYDWSLRTNQERSYRIYLLKDHNVDLRVTSKGVSDVDLFVYDGNTLIHKDIRIDPHCYVSFEPSKSGYYKVKVWNRLLFPDPGSKNGHNHGKLTFYQFNRRPVAQAKPKQEKQEPVAKDEDPAAEKKDDPKKKPIEDPKNPPQPKVIVKQQPPAPIIRPPVRKPPVQVYQGPYVHSRLRGSLPKGGRSKRKHGVYLVANNTYTIDLKSDAFDTVLELQDFRGKRLASNDDINFGGGNRNSRIVFRPTKSANYQLQVRSFGYSGSGPYQITIEYMRN